MKDTKVTVFTTKEIISRIKTYMSDLSDYELVLEDEGESKSAFLERVNKICNEKIDLLFVNTIQFSTVNIPSYIKLKPKSKMILTIHTTNHWLIQKFALPTKNLFRSIDANISIILARKMILPKYDAISVIYAPLKKYIKQKSKFEKPIFTIPFNFYDKEIKLKTKNKSGKISFVIPGLIEPYRRNYDLALKVFEELFIKYKDKISLTLLGKPVGAGGEKVILKCEELKKKGFDITYSKGFIPEDDYNQTLGDSDIIFSPLNVIAKRETGIKEIYGKTEGSAVPFEAIQYVKPLIVPKDFEVVDEMKKSTITYESTQNLENKIVEIIEDKEKLDYLKKEAKNSSEKFSLEVLQKYFKEEILNKINNFK